jgi:NAD kinase
VVYSAGDVVKLELLTESREVTLTVDGQVNFEMKPHDLVIAERFDHSFQLVQPLKTKFFDTLRDKLNWGGQANYASHSDC